MPPKKSRKANRFADNVQSKAQEVAKEDYDKAKVLIKDAAESRAYLYPIKGIFYFFTHQPLWRLFFSRLTPTLLLSAGVVSCMFVFAYVPQLAVLVFVNGPLAIFTTGLLILNESSTIISILNRNFLLQEALLDTFDGTLVARNATDIVQEGRQLKAGSDPIAKLGKILKSPFDRFSPKALIRYIIYLPLNFIPVVGTVVFILVQGKTRGNSVHERYFQLKQWSSAQQSAWIEERRGAYTAFGIVATLLELIPFVSVLFAFTNTVGAALWAADIEATGAGVSQSTAPGLREEAKKTE